MSKLLAGRYELIEKIGEGGMAVVYKAKCRLLNRYVAIKILRPEFTKDAQFVENFKRESQAAAGLQHQNIVSVYDVGKEGNIHFIVMELIDGRPLSDLINEHGPFDYRDAMEITKQVASALSLAHKNNIIHRDVKPHNIMITKDGIAKLADFGIAKAVSSSTMVANETSRIIGSVHYFSPEQARGSYVDERSDIYSLGIVLYEMLTGQVPFDGENPVQVALMHINDEITPPSHLAHGIPPALEKLVMKATDKYQSNRYKNAEEVLEELNNIDFVTKMVGKSVFAGSHEEQREEHRRRPERRAVEEYEEELERPEEKKVRKEKKEKREPAEKREPSELRERTGNGKKKLIIGAVAVGIAFVAAIIGILFATGVLGSGVEIPTVTGMEPAAAEKLLEEAGLKVERGEDVRSEDVEKGQIASQSPEAGTRAEKGDTVTIMVCIGKPTGVVPGVVGQEYDKTIEVYLEAEGYKVGSITEEESDAEKGEIISQDPAEGTEAEQGTKINLVISKGTDKLNMPSLLGQTIDEAKQTLLDCGFVLGKTNYAESTVYAKNIVMDQSYPPGEKVKKGTKVDIIVSKGEPEAVPEPEPEEQEPESGDAVLPEEGGEGEGDGDGEE
ncbi:MAG: Stk1 family PASTA domain-containing Ser/Thr kinase [Firmicutes bacterium]|nr:Stk1 family PASTA domain-containing Ser/Thr kinase [Bacillota bacterium]